MHWSDGRAYCNGTGNPGFPAGKVTMSRFSAMLVDLDGTLMVTDEVTPRVSAALARVSKVIPVSIATGRRASDVKDYAGKLGLSAPQICNGGATLIDPLTGKYLWNSHLQEKVASTIIKMLGQRSIPFIATHPTGDSETVDQINNWDLTRISAMDISESHADELVSMFAGEPDLNVVKVYLHYNGWWAVDFTAAGVHKGAAALILAERMGVNPQKFIAAGDSSNDQPMLEVAGLRIAMASAPLAMKEIADFVAPPVEEDGLAVAIEEVVLPALFDSLN